MTGWTTVSLMNHGPCSCWPTPASSAFYISLARSVACTFFHGICTRTLVPSPGWLSIWQLPPTSTARLHRQQTDAAYAQS